MGLIWWLLRSREHRARVNRILSYEEENRLAEMVPWWDFTDGERRQAIEHWAVR